MTDRRARAQVIGSLVAIAALLWALLLRDDVALPPAQASVGWMMVAVLGAYVLFAWRGRR